MRRALLSGALFLGLALAVASPAQAAFGLNGFEVSYEDENGAPVTQAGSHPFAVTTTFKLNTKAGEPTEPDGELRDLEVQLPIGFAGAPSAVPPCAHADFLRLNSETFTPDCPDASAVGVAKVEFTNPGGGVKYGLYSLVPPPGAAAELGFRIGKTPPVIIDFYVKPSDPYNVLAKVTNAPQVVKLFGSKLTVWGNPADPVHDELRGGCVFSSTGAKCPAGIEEKPFVTLPRACPAPAFATYSATSWDGATDSGSSGSALQTTGCGLLGFSPEVDAQLSTSAAESASGLDLEIEVDDPQLTDPDANADSDIRAVTLALPEGVTVNPSSGAGQGACSSAQIAAESLSVQGCPEDSKLGRVEVETPLLDKVLGGDLYLAAQNDNPFNSLLALYIVIKDPELGVLVKQPVQITPDPVTGQLVSTTTGIPQLPFSSFRLHFRSGPRAPLATPGLCGTYATKATLTPWNDSLAPVEASSSFTVDANCAELPFGPTFAAGTRSAAASTFSPFDMRITRTDREPELTRFSATLPAGVVPKLAGVGRCTEAQIAAAQTKTGRQELASPSCPASSSIGQLEAGAGVGSALTWVPGSLYLAGPYNGDPLSAVAIVPAIAGPLDVGTVVTRVGLTLNPVTYLGEIHSYPSEPFPRILAGIPLHLRDLRVHADRPQFTLNATGCEAKTAAADIFGLAVANPLLRSVPYQASGCKNLGFNPKLALQLSGAIKRSGHPKLHSVLSYPYPSGPGYSNIGRAVVTLPPSLFIDQDHISNPCTRVQFEANQCPPGSVLGKARATSPLLDEALEGPVYFRSNGGARPLPDIVADLHGIVDIELVGQVDAKVKGEISRIRTTFANVPDTPVTKFTLDLNGGKKKGLLVNSRNLCKSPQKASLLLRGQNNHQRESQPKIKVTSCKGKGKPKR